MKAGAVSWSCFRDLRISRRSRFNSSSSEVWHRVMLKMETAMSSKMLVPCRTTTRCHNPENLNLNNFCFIRSLFKTLLHMPTFYGMGWKVAFWLYCSVTGGYGPENMTCTFLEGVSETTINISPGIRYFVRDKNRALLWYKVYILLILLRGLVCRKEWLLNFISNFTRNIQYLSLSLLWTGWVHSMEMAPHTLLLHMFHYLIWISPYTERITSAYTPYV
jgi:hypothetical protein